MNVEKYCYEVFEFAGIRPLGESGGEIYYPCPFCGTTKKKFSVPNASKIRKKNCDGYHCWSCGAKGKLPSLTAQLSFTKDDYKKLIGEERKEVIEDNKEDNVTLASEEHRHKVYVAMLKNLKLQEKHKKDLLRRGLSEQQIRKWLFKSLPTSYEVRKEICRRIQAMGLSLEGVPGFYVDKYGNWTFCGAYGYFCPVWDGSKGIIIGMQIRVDEPKDGNKYFWFACSAKYKGCSSGALATYLPAKNAKALIVTEGILKATVTYLLLGERVSVIGVPGINTLSTLNRYEQHLGELFGYECFDMDKAVIPTSEKEERKVKQISGQANALTEILKNHCAYARALKWNADNNGIFKGDYKGIDDMLYAATDEQIEQFIKILERS